MFAANLRVCLVQIESHPALIVDNNAYIEEPFLTADNSSLCALDLEHVDVSDYRNECKARYISWQLSRLSGILEFLTSYHCDLIVFPEGAIPSECLVLLKEFALSENCCIFAGTHSYQKLPDLAVIYQKIGADEKDVQRLKAAKLGSKSTLPVLTQTRSTLHLKETLAPFEKTDFGSVSKELPSPRCVTASENVPILPLVCAEAINDYQLPNKQFVGVVVVSYTEKPKRFQTFIDTQTNRGRFVVYCNDGRFGKSRIDHCLDNRNVSWWYEALRGELPPGDSILIKDINLSGLAVQHGVDNPSQASQLVLLSSIAHDSDPTTGPIPASEIKRILQDEDVTSQKLQMDELLKDANVTVLQAIKLQHLSRLVQRGTQESAAEILGNDLVIKGLPSLRELEKTLATFCHQGLQKQLTRVRSTDAVNVLVKFLKNCEDRGRDKSGTAFQGITGIRPEQRVIEIIGREHEVRDVLSFYDGSGPAAFLLTGLEGIGKSAILRKAQIEYGVANVHVVTLNSNSSPEFIYLSILRSRFTRAMLPEKGLLAGMAEVEFTAALKYFDAIIIENVADLIRNREWRERDFGQFIPALIRTCKSNGVKLLLESRTDLPIDYDENEVNREKIGKLTEVDAIRLLNAFLRNAKLRAEILTNVEKSAVVNCLGSHPKAISLFPNAIHEFGVKQVMEDIQKRKNQFSRYIERLVKSLGLASEEEETLRLLSGLRRPVDREIVSATLPHLDLQLVPNLVRTCCIDVDDLGCIEIAPLLRGHFDFSELDMEVQSKLHENAALSFERLFRRYAERIDFGAESDYHAAMLGRPPNFTSELVDSSLSAADEHFGNRNFEKSSKILSDLLHQSEASGVLRLAAMSFARCGEFGKAFQCLDKLISKGELDASALNEITRAALSLHRTDVAEELLELATRARVDAVTIGLMEGKLAQKKRQLARAEEAFRNAVRASTRNAWPHLHLGKLLYGEGRFSEAIEVLYHGESIAYDGYRPDRRLIKQIKLTLALSYLFDDCIEESDRYFETLLQEAPDDPEVVRGYAIFLAKTKNIEDAERAFETLRSLNVKRHWERSQKHLFLGLYYLGKERYADAILEFEEAHKADSSSVLVLIKWAESLLRILDEAQIAGDAATAMGMARKAKYVLDKVLACSPANKKGLILSELLYNKMASVFA